MPRIGARMPRRLPAIRRSDRTGRCSPSHAARPAGSRRPTALVTGGAGFLGSHLCERLLAERPRGPVRRQFLHRHAREHRCICSSNPHFESDAPRRHASRSTSRSTRSTISPARPRRSTTSTTRCRRPRPVCIGAINMLGLAKRAEVPRSCRPRPVGGLRRPAVHPQTEDYWGNVNPIGPRSCYDEGKRCAETLFFDYRRQHSLRDQGRADLQHLRAADAPERRPRGVELHRPGAARRGHHDLRRRLPDALVLLRRRPHRRSRAADGRPTDDVTGPINIGNPGEFTIRELAEMVIAMTGSRSKLVHRPLPADDPRSASPTSRWPASCSAGSRVPLERGPRRRRSPISKSVLRRDGARAAVHREPRAEAYDSAAGRALCLGARPERRLRLASLGWPA